MSVTDEERETLGHCDACMDRKCSICGHYPCPVCIDDCDHPDCIVWDKRGHGDKTHECKFERCEEHR